MLRKLLPLGLALGSACSQSTQLYVVIDDPTREAETFEILSVEVAPPGGTPLPGGRAELGGRDLPRSFAVVPATDPDGLVDIRVRASAGPRTQARLVRTRFLRGRRRDVWVDLSPSCDDVSCDVGRVCRGGACVGDGPIGDASSGDAGPFDAPRADTAIDAWEAPRPCARDVDILFLVDDSGSMDEHQMALAAAMRTFATRLAFGDVDGDRTADFPAPQSIHAGVVSSSVALATPDSPMACEVRADRPADGVLATASVEPGCTSPHPAFVTLDAGADATAFADAVGCALRIGSGGCGWEQQLEATLKALAPEVLTTWTAPDYTPPTFLDGTHGHALGANRDFQREGSVLAIVMLTDEEDCSVLDPAGAGNSGSCHRQAAALRPPTEVARTLLALRPSPADISLTVIGGTPMGRPAREPAEFDAVLADPQMAIDATMGCFHPSGHAPRRLVEAARAIRAGGGRGAAISLCEASLDLAMETVLEAIADASTCAPAP